MRKQKTEAVVKRGGAHLETAGAVLLHAAHALRCTHTNNTLIGRFEHGIHTPAGLVAVCAVVERLPADAVPTLVAMNKAESKVE
jgi:hypothetical protein